MNHLKLEREGRVALIQINRPPANALSSGLIREMDEMLDQIENDAEIRVALIYGEGRFFSAGADIKEFTTVESESDFSELSFNGQDVFERMENFPKPLIAAIHGAALGGGLEMAMGCHIRLVAENAKLGLPELQLGLIPGFAGTQRLPRLVGTAKAAEMMLTSDPITGRDAVLWGLANQAYPEEELFDRAKEMAAKIAKKSPLTTKAAIELLRYSKSDKFYEGMKEEARLFGQVFNSEDGKEGISAFIEKREPDFKGN